MTERRALPLLYGDLENVELFSEALARVRHGQQAIPSSPEHVSVQDSHQVIVDPNSVEQGLAKLVLSLIELLRQLLENQGLRRMDQGTLSDEEIERMGETFLKLSEKMDELKISFGLDDADLELQLGRLAELVSNERGNASLLD